MATNSFWSGVHPRVVLRNTVLTPLPSPPDKEYISTNSLTVYLCCVHSLRTRVIHARVLVDLLWRSPYPRPRLVLSTSRITLISLDAGLAHALAPVCPFNQRAQIQFPNRFFLSASSHQSASKSRQPLSSLRYPVAHASKTIELLIIAIKRLPLHFELNS